MLIKQHNKLFKLKVPRQIKLAYVWGKGLGVFADRNFKKGEIVIQFKAEIVPASKATAEAVQIDTDKFIDTKWLVPEAFINHSCSANTRIDLESFRYVAIKNIRKNDEITYNYFTTEYDSVKYHEDFKCMCGSKNCMGWIKGFKYLTHSQKLKLKPFLSPFLLKKLESV
jgi:uncharacterized protein